MGLARTLLVLLLGGSSYTASGQSACTTGVDLSDSGSVSSGNDYGSGADCQWKLTCSRSNFVPVLTFTSFDLEAPPCVDDTACLQAINGWGDYTCDNSESDRYCVEYANEMECCPVTCGACPPECYTSADGSDYRGNVATTTSGKVCMSWSVETKSDGVTGTWTGTFGTTGAVEKGIGDHSYCRNPDGEPAPWCYTTDPSTRWEACDIGQSQSSDYVNIFDGGAATGDPARALRGTTLPDVVVGMGQALTVQLTSDSGTEGAGFEASFTCAMAACLTGIPASCATSDVGKYRSTGLYSAKQHSGAPIDTKWTILL
jgi:hypothetical protein